MYINKFIVHNMFIVSVFMSGLMFLISMLLLKFSHTVPSFGKLIHFFQKRAIADDLIVAAYVFYALAQVRTFFFEL